MLGASIALAIEGGTVDPSAWVFVAIVVLVLHAVNFYHGKIMSFADARMIEIEARPVFRSVLLISNTVLFLIFCVMAARITDAVYLAGGETALRIIDIGIVASELRLGDSFAGRKSLPSSLHKQLRYWQRMNVIALIANIALLGLMPVLPGSLRYPLVVSVLAVLVSVDLVIEYWGFRANYFQHRADSWSLLAERWDRLQGRYGDVYRQTVIHPHLRAWARRRNLSSCVDLGCGNGCTTRMLAGVLGVAPLGVDLSAEMIDIAGLYEVDRDRTAQTDVRPRYLVSAVDRPPPDDTSDFQRIEAAVGELRGRQPGDLGLLAVFTAQDCGDLAGFFEVAALLLRPGEPLFIVYESDASFDPNEEHISTQRTWKYSLRGKADRVQVVTWLPVPITAESSRFASHPPDRKSPINVETHFRTVADYAMRANEASLELVSSGELLPSGDPKSVVELRYARTPRFCYAEFVRPLEEPQFATA
jgi:SAM-dependent methyltransferase